MDTNGDPDITFDEEGYCNYCTSALERLAQQKQQINPEKLKELFDRIKQDCKDDPYDCLVGVSGGLDSSYMIYLGHKYGLRMLGVHVDDGMDTETAKKNVQKLCEKAKVDLINIQPDPEQYRDLMLSFFKAAVPGLANPQDNLILAALTDAVKKYGLKYMLYGDNLAMESILQSGNAYTAADSTHIRAIQKQFSGKPIDKLRLTSTFEESVLKRVRKDIVRVYPLNLIDYRFDDALRELQDFCEYEYYGGKHHESVLCRFLQAWYLPQKYGVDKRKSHLSSLIVSGQMTRSDAIEELKKTGYPTEELKEFDFEQLSKYLGVSRAEFDRILALPPKTHNDYPKSFLSSRLIPFLLKHRKLLKI